ncbi:MAG TPA: pyridoxamine 5'-phosphate oxidase family protein [Acidimicrobiales bacterium]|nr:pyridoxamine 5'-phosphate oxidase family protein [Acidimicrobiales bacterium]
MQSATVEVDGNGLEVLDRAECLRLLAGTEVGRVGTTAGALPVVLPVWYRLVGDEIVFRTRAGTLLDMGARGTVVAFEADHFDLEVSCGWSVVVTGIARRLGVDELPAAAQLPGWTRAADECVVALAIELVSGRRMVCP